MTLTGIREGDIIRCDIRGDCFYAIVSTPAGDEHLERGSIMVSPISNGRGPVRIVKAREVIDHWRKSKRKARAA